MLGEGPFELDGGIQPGAVVRHNAFNAHTKAEDTPARMLASYFAPVGCLALPVNRGCAVLVVPELEDIVRFVEMRPAMTPGKAEDCRITSAGDAALQAQARLHALGVSFQHNLPGCLAVLFRPTAWASQQKSRVAALHVPALEDARLTLFERALLRLRRRLIVRSEGEDGTQEVYWVDSVVRPLVADNLANGRAWHAGFRDLCAAKDDGGKSRWEKIKYESEGLNGMMNDKTTLPDECESVLVEAVHQAIRAHLRRIRQDTDGDKALSQATKNRWDRFKERLRLDLVGAKTLEQCRQALCTLFGKAGSVPALQEKMDDRPADTP
jgi:CRISPR-associated protein Cas8a1/Csx13